MRLIRNREKLILNLCKDKIVLDVGCIDHNSEIELQNYWMHKRIKKISKKAVGLDILEDEADKLNKKGYDIRVGDVENVELNQKFEIIVAGEIIEHLSNPGLFLENMLKHLEKDGKLIITTPNSYAFRYFIRNFLFGKCIPNKQHCMYFDRYTLEELILRYNFKIIGKYYFLDDSKSKLKYYIELLFSKLRRTFSPRIMFVLEKIDVIE